MGELLDTFLDRQPRIALGIDTSSGSRLGHLFRGIGAESWRREHREKEDRNYGTDGS
jgi:hypothetical protein